MSADSARVETDERRRWCELRLAPPAGETGEVLVGPKSTELTGSESLESDEEIELERE
jgi:hypothetical protein